MDDSNLPPYESFHLSVSQRQALRGGVDVEALEQLLGRLPAGARELVLSTLAEKPPASAPTDEGALLKSPQADRKAWMPSDLVFDDPVLQALYERAAGQKKALSASDLARLEQYRRVERPARETPFALVAPTVWRHGTCLAVVCRRTEPSPKDLVLLDRKLVGVAVLHTAIELLLAERLRSGPRPSSPIWVPLEGSEMLAKPRPHWAARLENVLKELLAQPEVEIEGEGPGRVLEFRLTS